MKCVESYLWSLLTTDLCLENCIYCTVFTWGIKHSSIKVAAPFHKLCEIVTASVEMFLNRNTLILDWIIIWCTYASNIFISIVKIICSAYIKIIISKLNVYSEVYIEISKHIVSCILSLIQWASKNKQEKFSISTLIQLLSKQSYFQPAL